MDPSFDPDMTCFIFGVYKRHVIGLFCPVNVRESPTPSASILMPTTQESSIYAIKNYQPLSQIQGATNKTQQPFSNNIPPRNPTKKTRAEARANGLQLRSVVLRTTCVTRAMSNSKTRIRVYDLQPVSAVNSSRIVELAESHQF
mmetsp:Transcript_24774/g.40180  ORF Transcript_24774/g.40180 Transcript_24774/m.40180 type:complete len:144 (+) Transcript_24774:1407-1838(+)